MRKMIRLMILALVLSMTAGVALAEDARALPTGEKELLESARMWQARDRPEYARLALEKLLLAQPQNVRALLMLGDLEIRSNHMDVARRLLQRLQENPASTRAARQLADSYRLATRDRLALANVHRLAQVGRYAEALQGLHKLFPDGPPDGEPGIEYYKIIGSDRSGWQQARSGLSRLVRENPDDPEYRIALADLLTGRSDTRLQGLAMLARLEGRDDVNRQQVLDLWKSSLSNVPRDASGARAVRSYLARQPDDKDVQAQLLQIDRSVAARRWLETHAVSTGLAAEQDAQNRKLANLLTTAVQARPENAARVGALGLLRLQQGSDEAWQLLLRARELDAAHASRWRKPLQEALVAHWIHQADLARAGSDLDDAAFKLRTALALANDNTYQASAEATYAAQHDGRRAEAEDIFQRLLKLDDGDVYAATGYAQLLAADGRRDQALQLLARFGRDHPKSVAQVDKSRAQILRNAADASLAQGRNDPALRDLETAQTLVPGDPWLRYDLAKLYAELGLPQEGSKLMAEGVRLAPGDTAMRYAQALYLSSIDERPAALAALAEIPPSQRSAGMDRLQDRLRFEQLREQVLALAKAGDRRQAEQVLSQAEARAGDNLQQLAALARDWRALGEPQRGVQPLQARVDAAGALASPALLLALAQAQDGAGQDAALAQTLARLHAQPPLPLEQREDLAQLDAWLAAREARALDAQGRYRSALARLDAALQAQPDNRRLQIARAEVLTDDGRYGKAGPLYRQLLADDGADRSTRIDYARMLRLSGDAAAAREQLDRVQAQTPADDLDTRLSLSRHWLALDDAQAARAVIAPLQLTAGDAPEVWTQLGRIELAQRNYALAKTDFEKARQLAQAQPAELGPDGQPLPSAAARELAALQRRRQGDIEIGFDLDSKGGTAGVSQISDAELPVEARYPVGYRGHVFAKVDPVRVSAGTLTVASAQSAPFGTVQPKPAVVTFTPVNQLQTGADLALGYQTDDWRFDLGTTPLGFLVQDVVGGIKYSGSVGGMNLGFDLSRRPVTSSFLSYAGARDPLTGRVWGGVRSSGLDLSASTYQHDYDLFATLGYHRLTGRNVEGNNYFSLRTGGDWNLINTDDQEVSVGLVLTQWRYAENLGNYTFGQGGYYSPQVYTSLGLPLEWSGRSGRLSWLLKGAVSRSYTREKSMPYYPTDPALQASTGSQMFSGSKGYGTGYSLKGALEYHLFDRYFIGAQYALDRSAYYAPNNYVLYLRRMFWPWNEPVPYPPRPVRPYSQY
jgi:predicted Zn-dependent protease